MKHKLISMVMLNICLISPILAYAGSGKVSAINVNNSHGGVFIQITNETDPNQSVRFETDQVCVNDWVFVSTSDEVHADLFMSMAMSAKATGETVVITTAGCGTTLLGTKYPQLRWMDYGKRIN